MKSTNLLPTILLIACVLTSFSQTTIPVWEKQSGVRGTDFYTDVIEDKNQGYTVIGSKRGEQNSLDFWIVRYAINGDTLWTKTLGTEHKDIGKKITQLSDKSYLLLGTSEIENTEHLFLARIDENGKELWRKINETEEYLIAEDIVSFGENEFVLVGAKGTNKDNPKLWMAKIDSNGVIIWEKIYQDEMNGCAKSIKKVDEGNFAIAGQVSASGKEDCDIFAMRCDTSGNADWFSWIKTPGQKVWPECICCSPDSCFMVIGWKGKCIGDINDANPIFDFDMVLNKISCDGKILWTKNFDREGSEGGNALTIRPDGTFLIAGVKSTSFLGKIGPWLLNIDKDGNELNEKLLKLRFTNDQASRIINSSDGGFVVIGPGIQDESNSRSDGWIMKFAGL